MTTYEEDLRYLEKRVEDQKKNLDNLYLFLAGLTKISDGFRMLSRSVELSILEDQKKEIQRMTTEIQKLKDIMERESPPKS